MTNRCEWCTDDPLYISYHDHEWGIPAYDDQRLFEMLLLEGAQAGLSWLTILKRREGYRVVFDGFNAHRIASYSEADIAQRLQDPRIIRNRLKVQAFVRNANAYLETQAAFGTFSAYIWQFIGGAPRINHFATLSDIPTETPASRAMSKDLKQRGFTFVGATICYAYMQACGMVNDHTSRCYKFPTQA